MKECIEHEAAIKEIYRFDGYLDDDMIWRLHYALRKIPAADVVARDCYDKILAENDDMRAIIDTYGGLENIQSAFEKLHEIETADVVPVVRCGECAHWHRCLSDDGKIEYFNFSHCEKGHNGFPNFFCADGKRKDGDGE